MKPLLINTYTKGGAAKACIRLHEALLKEDETSHLLVADAPKGFAEVSTYHQKECTPPIPPPPSLRSWVYEKRTSTFAKQHKRFKAWQKIQQKQHIFLSKRPVGLEYFSFPTSNFDVTKSAVYQDATVVNLHWVANLIDYASFFGKNKKPIVWTLHDMSAFSGGEHYTEWYYGINAEGKPMQRQFSPEEINMHKEIIALKKQIFANVENLHIVTPSQWLKQEATNCGIWNAASYQTIPYGINTELFKPHPKQEAKKLLGFPTDVPLILFVAQSVDNQRKGFIYLQRAIEQMSSRNVALCAVGALQVPLNHPNVIEMGTLNDELLLSLVYSAADVFVIPSLMDNLPNTVLESLCCGTPVIGFSVGGIPDMVQHKINGLICEEVSIEALRASLEYFLQNPSQFDNALIASEAREKYALSVQAKAYKKLFQSIQSTD